MVALPRILLSLLTVMAVAMAQLAGLHSGWACECSGEPVPVEQQWCSGSDCHEHHPGEDHEDHHAPGGHQHEELRDALELMTTAPLNCPPPLLLEYPLPVPAELGIRLAEVRQAEMHASHSWLEDPGGWRPQEDYARRTAVLLI